MAEYTLAEAATRLGIKEATLRKRLQRRGSREVAFKRDGIWYLELDDAVVRANVPGLSTPALSQDRQTDGLDALVEHLREENAWLRAQLDRRAEDLRWRDELLGRLALPAPALRRTWWRRLFQK